MGCSVWFKILDGFTRTEGKQFWGWLVRINNCVYIY